MTTMRIARSALALVVLITFVVSLIAYARVRVQDDGIAAALTLDDDLVGPPVTAVVSIEVPPPIVAVQIVETRDASELAPPPCRAVLTAAPKTSPPASRS